MYSVVIPFFNSKLTIERAVKSVVNQVIKPFEIIIVNDGSDVENYEFLITFSKKFPDYITLLHKDNGGAASARNYGANIAKTKVLAFLDADDMWLEDKMALQLELINNNYSAAATLYNPVPNWARAISKANILSLTFNKQLFRNHVQTSTFVVTKSLFDLVGGFPEGQTHAEEGDLYFKILNYVNISIICFPLVIYGNGSNTFNLTGLSGNIVKMHKGELLNLKRLKSRLQIGQSKYISLCIFSYLKFAIRYCRRH